MNNALLFRVYFLVRKDVVAVRRVRVLFVYIYTSFMQVQSKLLGKQDALLKEIETEWYMMHV